MFVWPWGVTPTPLRVLVLKYPALRECEESEQVEGAKAAVGVALISEIVLRVL